MAKQIKAYVEVEAYVEVSQGRAADLSALLSSALVVDDFGAAIVRLAETASGATPTARVLSGPHGVGKSTALTLLYALAGHPNLRGRAQSHHVQTAASYLAGVRQVPVFVEPTAETPDFDAALREAFDAATQHAAAAGISDAEWGALSLSDDPVAHALSLLPDGVRLLLIVDGVSDWTHRVERDVVRRAARTLTRVGELAYEGSLSAVVALDEESLEGNEGIFVPLLRYYQVEYLPLATLARDCDRHLFKKESRQRAELGSLYDTVKRLVPSFRWNREDFVALYPLHPATMEVASAARRYAPNFSFLRFAATAGNRAKGRRELSLIVLDELFDTCEYELRKAPEVAEGFEVYDDFANNVIPKLPDSQQRFWAKLVLKGLFLYSLAGQAVTARDLADSMMLYDESSVEAGARSVRAILASFEERAAGRFTTEGEGDARSYRMPVADQHSGARVVNEIARAVASDDPRLGDILIGLGGARFADWPAGLLDGATGSAELEVPWRGTWRQGALCYRAPSRMVEIPPLTADVPLGDADPLAEFSDSLLDLGFEAGVAAAPAAGPTVERMLLTFTPAETICELDWEVGIIPVGAPIELRQGPATLVSWVPGEPSESDLMVLRRLAALRTEDPRLVGPGVDLEGIRAEAEAEGGLVFHRVYLERGRFIGPEWEMKASEHAARETVGGLLARVLDAPLSVRYPQHPVFAGELDDATARLLVEQFFVGASRTPNVQQAAGALAVPLGLAEEQEDGGSYRFNPSSEATLSQAFNVEPLRLAEAAGENGVPIRAVYQALRREPFGLQRPAQHLILAAMVASGRLKLTGPGGELTAAGLESAGDFGGYTHLQRSGLTVYSNEVLLEWVRLLTEAAHLNDLVTMDGRLLVRKALEDWLASWRQLDLKARIGEVPAEAATRRTWQLIAASKQYFDTSASCVRGILDEEIALEEGLGRIVNTFAANPTIYQRALRDLRMLTTFVDWVPFYTHAKEYVLSADRTAEEKIEAGRAELLDFVSAPHRLLDESKRRRFETVYETFLQDYVDYYVAAHELQVGNRADFEALDGFLDGPQWLRFELLSQVRVVNGRYYSLSADLIQMIRDLACDLPTRELLHERPSCVCSFRLTNPDGVGRIFERLRFLVEQGTTHHMQTIAQYRQPILAGLRQMQADSAYADASVPLIALLSGGEVHELTPSTVELINRCLEDQALQIAVAPPPPLEPGQPMAKETIRRRLQEWLEALPGDDGALIEIGRMLPGGSDD